MNNETFSIIATLFPFFFCTLAAFMIDAYRTGSTISAPVVSIQSIRLAFHVTRFKVATYVIRCAVLTLRTLNTCKALQRRTSERMDAIEDTIGTTEDRAMAIATVKIETARLYAHNVVEGIKLGIAHASHGVKINN